MAHSSFFHVDVFASRSLTGNGLAVFMNTEGWSAEFMQGLTQEMKQFESIFLSELSASGARARVFTVEEELPFAGHPVLGAAAVLHRTQCPQAQTASWILKLASGDVPVRTENLGDHYLAEMNQGAAVTGEAIPSAALRPILAMLGLSSEDLAAGQNAQVISTGLPYLILPVRSEALGPAAIRGSELETLLATFGAKFILLLDIAGFEIRTWDNLGRAEDVATGSAAGPAAAYLFNHGLAAPSLPLDLAQGRFANRPSRLRIRRDSAGALHVSGEVWPVTQGSLDASLMTGVR